MKILIFGFGVTGIASAKAFDLLDIQYDILDKKSIGDICEIVEREKVFPKNLYNNIKTSKRLLNPHIYKVSLSEKMRDLKQQLIKNKQIGRAHV